MKTFSAAALFAVLAVATVGDAYAQSGFQVVVNEGNSITQLSAADLSRIYLRQQTSWPNGTPVVPVDLDEGSPVRERFSASVLGKTTAQIKAHWQRQVFSGRAVPPAEQSSDRATLAFVAANAGAVGYVGAGADLPAGVRAIALSSGGAASSAAPVMREGAVEQMPQLVSRPPVRYPARQLREGTEGAVVLEFVVNAAGRVDGTSISVIESTGKDFEAPAIEAVRRSAFRPGKSGGRPVPVQVRQSVKFSVAGR